jgi:hypothetical protein
MIIAYQQLVIDSKSYKNVKDPTDINHIFMVVN